MSTSKSSATDEARARARRRRWWWAAIALYTVQTTLALFGLIVVVMTDLPAVIQIYGDRAPLPGTNASAWVALYARGGGSASWETVSATARREDGTETPVTIDSSGGRSDAVLLRYAVGEDGAPLELSVTVSAEGLDPRTVVASIEPSRGTSWLEARGVLGRGRPRSARAERLEPGLTSLRSSDACARRVELVSDAGSSPARMRHHAWVRVVEPDGRPAVGVAVELVALAGAGRATMVDRTTDGLGLARAEVVIEQDGVWNVRFDCDGATAERSFRWVPTQDGYVINARSNRVGLGETLEFGVTGLREHGRWYWDIVCDGRRVASGVEPGTSREVAITSIAPRSLAGAAICSAQAYLYLVSDNPPVAVRPVLVGADDAVGTLSAALERARGSTRSSGIGSMAAAAASDRQLLDRYVAWALAQLSPEFVPLPMLVDDSEAAWREFRERRAGQMRLTGAVAFFDLIVLIGGIGWLIAAGMKRQRVAIDALAIEDGELEPGESASKSRPILVIVVGAGLLAGVCAGFVLLLRAMSL